MLDLLTRFLTDDILILGSIGCGCLIVSSALEHRKGFCIRVVISFLTAALWMLCTNAVKTSGMNRMTFGMIRYTVLFVIFGVSVPFCSKADFCQSVYTITVAYSIQNMCERIIEIPRYSLPGFTVLIDRCCLLLLLVVSLGIYYYLLFGNTHRRAMFDFSSTSSKVMLFLGVGVVGISILLDLFMRGETRNSGLNIMNCLNIMSAVFSFLAIVVCMSHLRESDSQHRAEVAAQLLYSEQRRYELEKQIHDAINIKCHDIRHQIAALGEDAYHGELKKIGMLVNIYDTNLHTKNAALDVILSGKMLACSNQGIKLTCLADGRRMGFIEDSDIYALFGNILDNAIEAVKAVPDSEHHIISLTVKTEGDLLMIDSENFYVGELTFEGGLPVTSKADKDYHGFGTRSIRSLTEKYGGDLQLIAKDGVFRLSIMIPIPV